MKTKKPWSLKRTVDNTWKLCWKRDEFSKGEIYSYSLARRIQRMLNEERDLSRKAHGL